MTKDEIKKALEICDDIYAPCDGCPYIHDGNCDNTLLADALALITEQEKEIKRLKVDFVTLECNYDKIYDEHKEHKTENENLKILNNKLCECTDYLKVQVKQAQIDVLNKAKEKLDSAPNGWAYTGYIDDLIKEVEKQ